MMGCVFPACADNFVFSLKGGVPITDYFQTGVDSAFGHGWYQYSSAPRRYTVGLSGEWRMANAFGIEIGVLYKRIGYNLDGTYAYEAINSTTHYSVKGHSWDFPILIKYQPPKSKGLFASGGYSVRHVGPIRARGTRSDILYTPTIHTVVTGIDKGNIDGLPGTFSGPTIGAGIELGKGRMRISPELRYTFWIDNSTGNSGLHLNNQLDFLIGLVFLPGKRKIM